MNRAQAASLTVGLAIIALALSPGCGEDSKKNPGGGEASEDGEGVGGQGGAADGGGDVDAGQGGGDLGDGGGGDGGDEDGGDEDGGQQDGGARDGGADGGEDVDHALAPEDFGGFTLLLVEPANDLTNSWVFVTKGPTGTATLGEVEAPYTYAKDGPNASTLTFDVGGDDVYSMTWTGESAGTCTESFPGQTPVDCTFEIQ